MPNYSISLLKFIEPQTLKLWLDSGRLAGGKFAIVDVRDDDFQGGHITKCLHVPSTTFSSRVQDLISEVSDCDDVVFHCALSQQRGPSSALHFLRSLPESANFSVYVLRGGFTEWQRHYGKDSSVTVDYDPNMWRYY